MNSSRLMRRKLFGLSLLQEMRILIPRHSAQKKGKYESCSKHGRGEQLSHAQWAQDEPEVSVRLPEKPNKESTGAVAAKKKRSHHPVPKWSSAKKPQQDEENCALHD